VRLRRKLQGGRLSQPVRLRDGQDADIAALQALERRADARFQSVGLGFLADGPPTGAELFHRCLGERGLIVAVSPTGAPLGFLASHSLDQSLYLAQISVDPAAAGQGLGARLIDAAARRTRRPLSLFTFRTVPWNAPYYARLGFAEVAPDALGPDHWALWTAPGHAALGLNDRVAMQR